MNEIPIREIHVKESYLLNDRMTHQNLYIRGVVVRESIINL